MWARSHTSGDWSGENCRLSSLSESGASSASVRARARSSSDREAKLGKTAEDERRDHRSLPHRRGDALRRAVPHVPGGEEPDAARLERERIAVERPAVGRNAGREEILAGQDVAGGIGEDVLA